ncbi:hypothetical protein ACFFP0_04320 [Rhizobium puerariae]|uniref:Uncharacterized protein n=1 Tax=Rhizobium puerariae TaxID=1585791 RepID=A0ABV6ABQ2_9HYPH
MTARPMTIQTFSALPPITMEPVAPANPLRGVLVTVFTLKIIVSVFLLATVSLAPPVSSDLQYTTASAD